MNVGYCREMAQYFTFFLCGQVWTEPAQAVGFLEWLVEEVPRREKLQLNLRKKELAMPQRPAVSGEYIRNRAALRQIPIGTVSVADRTFSPLGAELSFVFENVHYDYKPGPAGAPEKVEVPNGIKVLSLSIRRDIWNQCEHRGISTRVIARVEQLFANLGCLYGYGQETAQPITGRFCLISSGVKTRIVDFDYARHIEAVYRFNYLSDFLLGQARDPETLCSRLPDVECKELHTLSGERTGSAIYLKSDSPQTSRFVSDCLWPLPVTSEYKP